MPFPLITSTTNETIKAVVRLHSTRERKEKQLFIIEGLRAIATALTAELPLNALYCSQEQLEEAKSLTHAKADAKKIVLVSPEVMKKISAATTPSGLLAVFGTPKQPKPESLTSGLVLAEIQDPGNMGTLIRTAAACGIKSIVVVEGVDPWSPKVVQSSAGTIALVPIFEWDWNTLVKTKQKLKLSALVVSGGISPHSIDPRDSLIVVGNEARGIPEEWLKDCDQQITLPMPGGTESLNAAVAGSIAVYLAFCKQHL